MRASSKEVTAARIRTVLFVVVFFREVESRKG